MKKFIAALLALILCVMPIAFATETTEETEAAANTEQVETPALNSIGLEYKSISSFADFQELFIIAMYLDLSNR